eukprot:TRINITY_DN3495_c0_g1_i3.p1 TRINITY_DN3495_c0_g1~~TRINITY_DN3495_c0_g1_i3.p1  ORF type:complete len:305 (+),score=66.29 TRINITY_DN3495_c0_g1_i3:556-1470(+)
MNLYCVYVLFAGKRGNVELSGSLDSEGTAKASFSSLDKIADNLKFGGSVETSLSQKGGNASSTNVKSRAKPSIPLFINLNSSYYWRTYGIGLGLKYSLKYRDSLMTSVDFDVAYVPSSSTASTAARTTANAGAVDRSGSWSFGFSSSVALGSSAVEIRSKEIKKLQAIASYRAPNNLTSFYISSETGDDIRTGVKYQQEVLWWNKGKFGITAENVRKTDSNSVYITGAAIYNLDAPSSSSSRNSGSVSNAQLRGVINSNGSVFCGYSASLGDHTTIRLGAKFNLKNLQSPKTNQFGCTITFKDI